MGEVRIIGGEFRGRKITFSEFSPDAALRPTPDRVRETLFNWLMPIIVGADCLDAFGGSGILSFEAVSRGTNHVTLIENCPKTLKEIQQNRVRLKIAEQKIQLLCQDTLEYLAKTSQTFDVIFLDPPFQKNLLYPAIQLIAERQLLRPDGLVYVESGERFSEEMISENWEFFRSKKAGNVYYGLVKGNHACSIAL